MKKKDAFEIVEFVEQHFDYVGQDDWFDFCDKVLGIVVNEANRYGYAKDLAKRFPSMFRVAS